MVTRSHNMNFWMGLSVLAVTLGCRTDASLYVWTPPVLESAVGQEIAVAPLLGEPQMARDVLDSVHASKPSDIGRRLTVRTMQQLQSGARGNVMLASAIEQSASEPMSDLTLLALARQGGVDWLLMGEVLADTQAAQRRASQASGPSSAAIQNSVGRLAVVWRLYDVAAAKPVADHAVVVSPRSIAARYPDLADATVDPMVALPTAAGREAWTLVTPSIQSARIALARPWWRPGSERVRIGNELAQAGDWPAAATRWAEVSDAYRGQHAAVHNLAIASAAAQDFSLARRFIRDALQMRDCKHYRQTAAWIETQQREYHRAFALPDPPEGWTITSG